MGRRLRNDEHIDNEGFIRRYRLFGLPPIISWIMTIVFVIIGVFLARVMIQLFYGLIPNLGLPLKYQLLLWGLVVFGIYIFFVRVFQEKY